MDGPLADPEELDAADAPGLRQSADELEARRTILGDPTVQEAHVVLAGDAVFVTAVLLELGAGDADLKAEQFVIASYRQMERPARTPDAGPLAPSRFTYLVTLRDVEGDVLYEGIKPAAVATLTEEPRRR